MSAIEINAHRVLISGNDRNTLYLEMDTFREFEPDFVMPEARDLIFSVDVEGNVLTAALIGEDGVQRGDAGYPWAVLKTYISRRDEYRALADAKEQQRREQEAEIIRAREEEARRKAEKAREDARKAFEALPEEEKMVLAMHGRIDPMRALLALHDQIAAVALAAGVQARPQFMALTQAISDASGAAGQFKKGS